MSGGVAVVVLLGALALLIVLLAVAVAVTYNRLVRLRNKVATAWSGIDVQLVRRAELVPNLVETVRAASAYEREVLESVTAARAALVAARGPAASGRADDDLERALGRLWAVAEAYPALRASENFRHLQEELSRLEEDISFARRYYNGSVEQFNNAQQQFPTTLIAGALGFHPAEFFKADAEARRAPRAELS
ncbi:MAG TPA: LemA family protein [Natronosporangium sp.]|nr:LemA family protein [Natronosporangium sp.]